MLSRSERYVVLSDPNPLAVEPMFYMNPRVSSNVLIIQNTLSGHIDDATIVSAIYDDQQFNIGYDVTDKRTDILSSVRIMIYDENGFKNETLIGNCEYKAYVFHYDNDEYGAILSIE